MRWVLLLALGFIASGASAQKPPSETFTCSWVGGDGKAAMLKFATDERGNGILWKISHNPDFMQAMFLTALNELGIVASRSTIDNAMPSGQRTPIVAELVAIDRKTMSFTYSSTSPVANMNWVYQGKCVKG